MDIVPYVLLLLMLGVNLCINTRRSNNFMFFVLFVFSAIRYDVGFDYPGYIETIVSGSDWAINRFELGQKMVGPSIPTTISPIFFSLLIRL